MQQRLSLYELNALVQGVIEQSMRAQYWVEAELAEANERRGHLFLDLIQKDRYGNTPIARAQAKCWASSWLPIRMHFERVTGQRLAPGMKVLLQVYPQFHPMYGFSWIVTDIDPTYTLGDMARRRQEIIQQLKDEGVFDMQKQLELPVFCQHIAVISSETAAGYGDFCQQLLHNDYGFWFDTHLFPAVMQGEQVEQSVISALNAIYAWQEDEGHQIDCVVIIRGGGATTDLSGFDTLALAENVANFPIPIITGIGHDRDESILDMVSHTRVKTPTAAAAFLIDHLAEVQTLLDDAANDIAHMVQQRLERERIHLTSLATRMPVLFSLVKTQQANRLSQLMQRASIAVGQHTQREGHRVELLSQRLAPALQNTMQRHRHRVELLSQRSSLLDPQLVLQRGYSMTMSGGRVVTSADSLADGEIIETRFANGTTLSKVWKKQ